MYRFGTFLSQVSVIYNAVENLQQYERISQLKCPKDMVKVLDIDWAASDKPVLATQDGCLRIMDMILATSSSPLMDYELQGTNLHCLLSVISVNPSAWSDERCSSWRKHHLSWSDEHCSSCCTLSLIRLYLDNIGRKCNQAALYVLMKELVLLWCGRQFLQITASFFSLLSKFGLFSFCSP